MCERASCCHGGEIGKRIVLLPLFWMFAPNGCSQPLKNLTVKLVPAGLTRRKVHCRQYREYKKIINKDLTWLTNFLGGGEFFFVTSIVTTAARTQDHNHKSIIGYDIGDEVGLFAVLLFEFCTDRNASHVQINRQNDFNCPIWTVLIPHKHCGLFTYDLQG